MSCKMKKTFVTGTPKPLKKVRIPESLKPSKSSSRQHVTYDCNICKGKKVNPRTKESHTKERELPVRNEPSKMQKQLSSHGGNKNISYPLVLIEQILNSDEDQNIDESDISEDNDDELDKLGEDDSEQHVDFDALVYDNKNEGVESAIPDINSGFTWIIYWIFKFQERYRLPNTTVNSLIKFIRYILVLIDGNTYSKFPKSLYMARKTFSISDQLIKYATCKKCCKLYAIKDLPTDRLYHCAF
ncbi:9527_t:CDS:2 [Funneliformis caledonium]|uniref:9527_t:CDS:1 n=1 Tax=Funneliformis caledonium TaxID=1117310 RepID=A0A9N9GXD8_9GLOM|nr:9527_t:CDS:2 [Funneliformis caledonium]